MEVYKVDNIEIWNILDGFVFDYYWFAVNAMKSWNLEIRCTEKHFCIIAQLVKIMGSNPSDTHLA